MMPTQPEKLPMAYAADVCTSEWTQTDTTAFLTAVKKDGTTVGQVLNGAAALAVYRNILLSPTAQKSDHPQSRMPGGAAVDQRPHLDPAHQTDSMLSNPTALSPNQAELSAAQDLVQTGKFTPSALVLPHTAAWLKFQQKYGYWPTVRATAAQDPEAQASYAAGDRPRPSYSFLGRLDGILKPAYGSLKVSQPRFVASMPLPLLIFYGTTHRDRLGLWAAAGKSHIPLETTASIFDDFVRLLRTSAGLS